MGYRDMGVMEGGRASEGGDVRCGPGAEEEQDRCHRRSLITLLYWSAERCVCVCVASPAGGVLE